MDIRKELLDILSDYVDLPSEEIDFDSPMKASAGINSFVLLSIVSTIEERFNIRIPNDALSGFKTLGDIGDYISSAIRS